MLEKREISANNILMSNKTKFLSLVSLIVISCNQNNADIKHEYYYSDHLKSIKHYRNGVLEGQSQWFYLDGTIEQTVFFKKGKEEGNAYYFYPSGALKHFRNWKDGKMVGYANDFFDSSVWVMSAVLYFNGQGHLIYKKNYDQQGKVISEEGIQTADKMQN